MADFQQYYGVPLPLEGDVPDLPRMALLWEQLPADSRTARRQAPALEWDVGEYLLWNIEFELRQLMWSLTYDKRHPRPQPRPLLTPGQRAEAFRRRDAALAAKDEIDRILGMGGRDG